MDPMMRLAVALEGVQAALERLRIEQQNAAILTNPMTFALAYTQGASVTFDATSERVVSAAQKLYQNNLSVPVVVYVRLETPDTLSVAIFLSTSSDRATPGAASVARYDTGPAIGLLLQPNDSLYGAVISPNGQVRTVVVPIPLKDPVRDSTRCGV